MGREQDAAQLYNKRAKKYDLYSQLFPIIGFRMSSYRKYAVSHLGLKPGDTVIDLGCGTGQNFPYLEKAVGKEGWVIGVDISDAMLSEARRKIVEKGWKNVELINCDIAKYEFPKNVSAIISTYSITLVPKYDDVIRHGASALRAEGRFVILDFKRPNSWPTWLVRLAVDIFIAPFGGSLEMAERHPWESLGKNLSMVSFREFYLGAVYIVCGEQTRS